MLACVSAAALSAFAPPLSTPPTRQSCHRLHAARMDDSYDEMVQHEFLQNSNAPRPAVQRQILNAPRTLNAAELHAELHGPSSSAVPDLQSSAFERGLQLGFSLAQHLPAMPMGEPVEEEPVQEGLSPCTIKLVGVGGGGGNTLNRVAGLDLGVERESCIEYIACNTDAQALDQSLAGSIIQIGQTARGLGAGGKPHVGEASALESSAEISAVVKDADMVFVTAGMGGGTGSGAAPVVANLARAAGCLTIGVVTTPFAFEGRVRAEQVRAHTPAAGHQRRPLHGPLPLVLPDRPPQRHPPATAPPSCLPNPIPARLHPDALLVTPCAACSDALRRACPCQADAAIRRFEEQTDILIVVSNDRLLEIVPDDVPCAQRVSTRRPAARRRGWGGCGGGGGPVWPCGRGRGRRGPLASGPSGESRQREGGRLRAVSLRRAAPTPPHPRGEAALVHPWCNLPWPRSL